MRDGEARIRPFDDSSVFGRLTADRNSGLKACCCEKVSLVVFLFATCCLQAQNKKHDLNFLFPEMFFLSFGES